MKLNATLWEVDVPGTDATSGQHVGRHVFIGSASSREQAIQAAYDTYVAAALYQRSGCEIPAGTSIWDFSARGLRPGMRLAFEDTGPGGLTCRPL
jgi:hypothetical protein